MPCRASPILQILLLMETIGVEVRRLNQHYFTDGKYEGTEKANQSFKRILQMVINEFSNPDQLPSAMICYTIFRPLLATNENRKNIKKVLTDHIPFIDQSREYHMDRLEITIEPWFKPMEKRYFIGAMQDSNKGGLVQRMATENPMTYIDTLIENCIKAKEARPIKEFIYDDTSQLKGIEKAIYMIEEVDGDPEKTFIDFSMYKQLKARACPKLNAPSPVIYVGSSTTGIKNRIEQHIGNGHKGTYALHLSHWFKGQHRITFKVYDVPIEVLQIIEDALSHDLAPAFGKQGGNNK